MEKPKLVKEAGPQYRALIDDLTQPIILAQDGEPVAVLMSLGEYETLITAGQMLTAVQARRAADKVVLQDLVGCALSSNEPLFAPLPRPHWRVPYRYVDRILLAIVPVDAQSGLVSFTAAERDALLTQVERPAAANAPA
jgi:PHD/YefM family antitoxin component YafN of YafNO toxin-antitoxin module